MLGDHFAWPVSFVLLSHSREDAELRGLEAGVLECGPLQSSRSSRRGSVDIEVPAHKRDAGG